MKKTTIINNFKIAAKRIRKQRFVLYIHTHHNSVGQVIFRVKMNLIWQRNNHHKVQVSANRVFENQIDVDAVDHINVILG